MNETVFTHVSPKAAFGIKRLYERRGATVFVNLEPDGTATVTVKHRAGMAFHPYHRRMLNRTPFKRHRGNEQLAVHG